MMEVKVTKTTNPKVKPSCYRALWRSITEPHVYDGSMTAKTAGRTPASFPLGIFL